MQENPNAPIQPNENPPIAPPQPPLPPTPTPTVGPGTGQPTNAPQTSAQPQPVANQQFVSASQMGWNQQTEKKSTLKSMLKPIIIAAAVLVVLIAGWLIYKSTTGYGIHTVQADGITYEVSYPKNARQVSIAGKNSIEANDPVTGKTMMLTIAKATKTSSDCQEVAGGTIKVIDKPTIEGEPHNLCYSAALKAYAMNFKHDDTWHYFALLPKDGSSVLDENTAKTIASSVSVR